MISVRAFFRNGKSQVYFDVGESNHVYYFIIYHLLFAVLHIAINLVLNAIQGQS